VAILDDLKLAAENAISAGARAARGQGVALKADFETLVRPQLNGVVIQMAAIADDLIVGNIDRDQASDDMKNQFDRVEAVILAAAELAQLAVQVIINAVMDALRNTINLATSAAIGFPLL
jgi:hypothetical protein